MLYSPSRNVIASRGCYTHVLSPRKRFDERDSITFLFANLYTSGEWLLMQWGSITLVRWR